MQIGDLVWYWEEITQAQPLAGVVVFVYGNPDDRVNLTVFRADGVVMPKVNVSVVRVGREVERWPYCERMRDVREEVTAKRRPAL